MIKQIKKLNKSARKDNRGAALITVVIVLLFISILCTLILYISAVNYRMKRTNYSSKVSFYNSEIPLENMESNLVEPVSISYNYALQITNSRYYTYSSVGDRKKGFYNTFKDQFIKTLHSTYSTENIQSIEFVKDVVAGLTGVNEAYIYTGTDAAYYSNNGELFIEALANDHKLDGADGMALSYIVLPRYDNNGNGDYVDDFITLELEDPVTHVAYDDDHIRVIFHDIYVVTVVNDPVNAVYNSMSVVRTDIAVQMPPIDWTGGTGTSGTVDFNANEMIFYINWQKR